jgi:hypothetical protein
MRFQTALWNVAVIVVWLGGLVGLAALDTGTAIPYVFGGVALTIAAGALVNRYWVLWVPVGIHSLGLLVVFVTNLITDGCQDCSDGGGWGLLIFAGLLIFTIPATAALAIGLGGRRLARRRSPPPAPHAP